MSADHSPMGHHGERKEDRRLVTGAGRFVGDLLIPGMLHMAVLRSPYPAARVTAIDVTAALAMEGVIDVITASDLGELPGPIPLYAPSPKLNARTPYPLARDRVHYVGEPVAAVVAVDRYTAEDALEAIAVEYDPGPAVSVAADALRSHSPHVHPDLGTNLAAAYDGKVGDPDLAFRTADRIVGVDLQLGRQSPQPIETRGLVASWDSREQILSVWDSTQSAHMVRRILAYLLGMPETRIRVIVRDVGGGFGGKNRFYPEEFLAAFLSIRHVRPVQWIADRREDLLTMYQEREQTQTGELALRADGTILGLRLSFIDDTGAYTPFGLVTTHMTALNAVGPYRIPNFEYRYEVAYTNKAGMAPYRGAGRPQGTFLIERLLDKAARELGVDPAEIRLRNLITAEEQPYDTGLIRNGIRMVYDGGDYPAAYRGVLERIGYEEFPDRQEAARAEGRFLGIGTGIAIEVASTNTAEGARVIVDRSGLVTVYTGACTAGQGLETVLAEVCADHLGVAFDKVTVVLGDTTYMPFGGGTWASRTAVTAGNAVAAAAKQVRDKAMALGAVLLEVTPQELELADGEVWVRSMPERSLSLGTLAEVCTYPNLNLAWKWPINKPFPWGDQQGLDATSFWRPDFTFSYQAHAAVVDVDPETGVVHVQQYAVVHDCGRVLNPASVDGQVVGGVVQGIGAALLEEAVYDSSGQMVTASFMDYLLPTAADAPPVSLDHMVTPGSNPLGVKGAGEGGIIPVAPVICAAIDNALADVGIFCNRIPVTPDRLIKLIRVTSQQSL